METPAIRVAEIHDSVYVILVVCPSARDISPIQVGNYQNIHIYKKYYNVDAADYELFRAIAGYDGENYFRPCEIIIFHDNHGEY